MLTDAQKVDIRRYCGFPLFGGVPTQAFGHRFYQWYGTLEFRMGNMDASEEAVVTGTYLANLNQLEADLFALRQNLDTDQAAVWKHNRDELRDRKALFDVWRMRLVNFFGIEPGPHFGGGMIELVV